MKNILGFLFLSTFIFLNACRHKAVSHSKIIVDLKMLDSIRQHSDSTYVKPYRGSDFVTAEYFISKNDSTITQLMKDSAGTIRQLIIEKRKHRIYVAQFYPNGQQVYKTNLDAYGQFDGAAEEFYPNGYLKRSGIYKHGFHSGKWKNYDEQGNYISTDEYNEDGQQVKTYKE